MSWRIITLFLAPVTAAVLWLQAPLRAEEKPVRELPLKELTSEELAQLDKLDADFKKATDLWDNGGRRPDAPKLFQPALAALQRLVGPEDARTVQRRAELALMLGTNQETLVEAPGEFWAAIEIRNRFLGPKDEFTLHLRDRLADALEAQGKYDEAVQELRALIPVSESVLGPANERTLGARRTLAGILEGQEKKAEAEKENRVILAAMSCAVGPDNEDALDAWGNLGGPEGDGRFAAFGLLGNSEEAEKEYRAALAVMERVRSAERKGPFLYQWNLYFLQKRLAECLEGQGKFQEAFALVKQMAEHNLLDPHFGNGLSILRIRNRVVEALMKTKEPVPKKKGDLDMSIVRGLVECGMSLTEVPDDRGAKVSTVDYPFLGSIPVRAKTYILQAKSLGFTNQRWTLYWTRDGFFIGAFYRRPGFSTKWSRRYVEEVQETRGEKVVGLAKAPTQVRFQKILEMIRFAANSDVIDQVRIRRVLTTFREQYDEKPVEIYSASVWGKDVMSYSRGAWNSMRIVMEKDGKELFEDNGL